MKEIHFIALMVGLFAHNSYAFNNQSVWLYGGVNFGLSNLESDVDGEGGQKSGYQVGLLGSALYSADDWGLNTTINWFDLNFDSEDDNDGEEVKLETRAFMFELSPLWKPHHRWYIGPKLGFTLGDDEIIVGPGNSKTSNSLIGLNTFYEIPWTKRKIRAGLHYHKLLDTPNRSANVVLFSLEVGALIVDNAKMVDTAPERFKLTASKKVELSEQMINFETGSSKLTAKSREFLNGLGSALRDITNDWEILSIRGHTDVRGSEDYNLGLSRDRVTSVVAALIEGGAPSQRIQGKAYGESKPLSQEMTKEAHAKNRRVELHFIGTTNNEKIKEVLDELQSSIF